ncbi:MAG TPA: AI-2E family transporter [Isosphaeraceae bacterium]|nr:AI-2E family transporter [Isosphaeraceae bacterium]
MPQSDGQKTGENAPDLVVSDANSRTLEVIASLLLLGAAWMLSSILVPFVLALILAVAMSPVVSWLERRGWPTTVGSLLCMLFVASLIVGTLGLMVFQAGSILQNSDKYVDRVGHLLAKVSSQTGGDRVMESLGFITQESEDASERNKGESAGASMDGEGQERNAEQAGESGKTSPSGYWTSFVRRNLQTVLGWVTSGIGGLAGFAAELVVFLAFLFYMLQTRTEWVERLTLASSRLGMKPRLKQVQRSQHEIVIFVGFVTLVASCYAIVTSIAFWFIGLPQPLLWGLLTGLLEFIPFFGPAIAGTLIALVALALGSLWQPMAVVGLFLCLHLVEGYIITPMVYGQAVRIDPVTTLVGILLFGWIWGPLGSMLAMPSMILLRGIVMISPDTPALDAIADVDEEKKEVANGVKSECSKA